MGWAARMEKGDEREVEALKTALKAQRTQAQQREEALQVPPFRKSHGAMTKLLFDEGP